MKKYIIIKAKTLAILEKEMNEQGRKGYRAVTSLVHINALYLQIMEKDV